MPRLSLTGCTALVLLTVSAACSRQTAPLLRLSLGDGSQLKFRPAAAFAEYLELPGLRKELRVTLASYSTTCERYAPPKGDETLISIRLLLPPDSAVEPGDYPSLDSAPPMDDKSQVKQASASVFVRHGRQGLAFQPGGLLKLGELNLKAHGSVAGEAGFESPPDSQQEALSLAGKFRAGVCRFQPAGSAQ